MAKKKVTMEKEILGEILNEQLLPVYSEEVVKRNLKGYKL